MTLGRVAVCRLWSDPQNQVLHVFANDTLIGVLLMTGAMLGFAIEDSFIKAAAGHMPTSQVLILLGFIGAMVFAGLCRVRGEPVWSSAIVHPAVVTRNLLEIVGTCCFVSAIVLMPLATTISIFQAIPIVVTLGAVLFLGAQVGWRRWSAIFVGFFGVLIVVRPGVAGFEPASLLALASTVALAWRDLITRNIPRGISSFQLATYGFVCFGLAGIIMLPFWGAPIWPDTRAMLLLFGATGAGMIAYLTMIAATRTGDIAVVTPFRYTRLLFAITLGAVFFDERPDTWTLVGAALILGSGVYTILRENRAPVRPLFTRRKPG